MFCFQKFLKQHSLYSSSCMIRRLKINMGLGVCAVRYGRQIISNKYTNTHILTNMSLFVFALFYWIVFPMLVFTILIIAADVFSSLILLCPMQSFFSYLPSYLSFILSHFQLVMHLPISCKSSLSLPFLFCHRLTSSSLPIPLFHSSSFHLPNFPSYFPFLFMQPSLLPAHSLVLQSYSLSPFPFLFSALHYISSFSIFTYLFFLSCLYPPYHSLFLLSTLQ